MHGQSAGEGDYLTHVQPSNRLSPASEKVYNETRGRVGLRETKEMEEREEGGSRG